MKKKLLNIAVFLLLLFGVVGGTAAYYTNQGTVTNVIMAGNIKVDLHIWGDLAMTEKFVSPEGISPNQDIVQVVAAENVGDNEAWIRIKVDKRFEPAEGVDKEAAQAQLSRVKMNIDRQNWLEKDGWYYYKGKLAAGEVTAPLFTTVTLEEKIDDNWQNGKLAIVVTLHAVQAANDRANVLQAEGWPNA